MGATRPKKIKRLPVARWCAVLLWLAVPGCRPTGTDAADPVVAWVDDAPVTRREYLVFQREERPRVHGAFHRQYRVTDEKAFWRTRFGGRQPDEVLRSQVLHRLARHRVKLRKARELGVFFDDNLRTVTDSSRVEDVSYAAFEAYYRQYASRAGRRAEGDVFYGPPDMTAEEKYKELCGRIFLKLEEKVVRRMPFGESELRAFFVANPHLFRTRPDAEPAFEAARPDVKAVLGRIKFERLVSDWAARASVRTAPAAPR